MKRKTLLFSIALGIIFDILFWQKAQGISFFIFTLVLLGFAAILVRGIDLPFQKKGYFFLVPISFFAILSFVHTEPLTAFLNRALVLVMIGIWAARFSSGNWERLGLIDYLIYALRIVWTMISVPWLRADKTGLFPQNVEGQKPGIKSILRGILLAIPVLFLFSLLFASADLAFAEGIENILQYLRIEQLDEHFARMLLIFLTANAFLGLILISARKSENDRLVGEEEPFIQPFLSSVESGIVLSSVLLLFFTFIILQFRYFFFNQTAIAEFGFSYSEYARRGFGELIAVSVISLALILSLSAVTKVSKEREKHLLSWMYTGLAAGNLVILVSAFMRLSLYESAYGFTRLRTYSHVFIIWLGLLLVAVSVIIWKNKTRLFANVLLAMAIGFSATLNLLNPDAFIVRQNVKRTAGNETLDSPYLASLSSDAVPTLVDLFNIPGQSAEIKRDIGVAILCYQSTHNKDETQNHWQSFTISGFRAERYLTSVADQLKDFSVTTAEDQTFVILDDLGRETYCIDTFFLD